MKRIIYPKIGFGDIHFGITRHNIINYIGEPEKMHEDEDGDILFNYLSIGIEFLCFEKDEGFRLTTIELNRNSSAILWGTDIFNVKKTTITRVAKMNNFSLIKEDGLPRKTYQELYQIKELSLDFYFDFHGNLENFCFGIVVDENDNVIWPK